MKIEICQLFFFFSTILSSAELEFRRESSNIFQYRKSAELTGSNAMKRRSMKLQRIASKYNRFHCRR